VQAFALRIIPKQTGDVRPLPKRQKEALTNLAKKAKKFRCSVGITVVTIFDLGALAEKCIRLVKEQNRI
jgi:hypothetical protein